MRGNDAIKTEQLQTMLDSKRFQSSYKEYFHSAITRALIGLSDQEKMICVEKSSYKNLSEALKLLLLPAYIKAGIWSQLLFTEAIVIADKNINGKYKNYAKEVYKVIIEVWDKIPEKDRPIGLIKASLQKHL